jgi:hypothetical protein
MPRNPRHRPPNERRIASMLRCYQMAWEVQVVENPDTLPELYGGEDFPPADFTMEGQLRILARFKREEYFGLSNDEERVVDWHDAQLDAYRKMSRKPRGDKMLAYRVAAALFNAQLACDQQGDPRLGLKPCRLDEKPTTPGAIQRALNRFRLLSNIQ